MALLFFRRFFVLTSLLFLPVLAAGQELTVEANADRTRLGVDEQLTFTVTVSGNSIDAVNEPTLPAMKDFLVVGQTSSSSSQINIINGRLSTARTIQYIYALQPRAAGQFVIGPATVTYKGKTYRTQPITIQVVSGSPGGAGGLPPQAAPDRAVAGENLFVKAIIDKNTVRRGEQITITYKLYSRANLSNVQFDRMPSYTGFWTEELFTAQHLDFSPEIVNGKRYDTAVLKRVALFPTAVGKQRIEPLSMLCDVSVSRRRDPLNSFFDDPFDTFFGRTQRVSLRTEALTVNVLLLPESGKPPHFSGGVGQFTIRASTDSTQAAVNQPLTLIVTVAGEGNLKMINEPVLPDLSEFKRYSSSSTDAIRKRESHVSGERVYTYVLIPKTSGERQIGPITFSFFDPAANTYRTVETKPIVVTVAKGTGESVAEGFVVNKEEVKQVKTDIQYIKPATVALASQGDFLYRNPWFLLLQALPILAMIGAVAYRSHERRLRSDVGYARRRRALGAARRELQRARRALKHGAAEQASTSISKGLSQYIADKLNVPVAGLTSQQLSDLLSGRGIEPDTIQTLRHCLDTCDMARFAPSAVTPQSIRDVMASAEQVIAAIEKRLVKTA
ncbi:MAG: protein BatD [Candidatus Latescibacteria bacterium]|nr:protein BatD [Candidatus Latescibacterota bacterium]